MNTDTGSVAMPPPSSGATMRDEQLPLLPGLVDTPTGPIGHLTLAIADLVLDGALQCRTTTSAATIAAYAEALREGATFPEIRVVRVDGQLLVVDGWHRVKAHVEAGRSDIEATVESGDRWHATIVAAGANASHGLQRTIDDKRRAVRILLASEIGAGLASRALAKLAGVSHTFVDEMRKRYNVKQGTVVSEKRIEQVDGEPTGEWKVLLDSLAASSSQPYYRTCVLACKAAQDLDALRAVDNWGDTGRRAKELRERELACNP